MKILAIVESLTGNTMSFIEYAKEIYGDNLEIEVVSPKEQTRAKELLAKYDKVMLGAYTWSHGKIPKHTKTFTIENRDILLQKDILIFGSGWTVYELFCEAVESLGIILEDKFPKVKFELRFDPIVEKEAVLSLKKFIGDV